jgi:UDP:flavonoid glycosyltransferase YjiC (YdhE family)
LHNTNSKTHERILAIPGAIGLSHLTRLLLIARSLRESEAKVAFAFKEKEGLLERNGFEVFTVPDVEVRDFSSNVFAEYSETFVEQMVEAELKAIEAFRPDAIVGDLRMTAAISSRVAGVPYISVVNAYMTDYFDPVDLLIPKERSAVRNAVASVAGKAIQAVQKKALATPFRSVAKKYGVRGLTSLYDFLRGDLTLLADLPEFCPLENLPADYRYIGPLIWEGDDESARPFLENRDRSKPLIYATTGNTGKEKLIELVFDAFDGDDAFEVVLTTGEYIQPPVRTRAKNIRVERFIPGSMVLKHCAAAIHCGGNGTTYQTIAQGVPAVVLPFNNDQKINGWLIKRDRLGIPLAANGLTGAQLRQAVKALIGNPSYSQPLEYFRSLLAKSDGGKNAVKEIALFLKAGDESGQAAHSDINRGASVG